MARAKASSIPLEDERKLVQRSQAGDQEAFALLYDAYMLRIYRYVFFRVADEQVAEDIASDVFLKAWEKLDTYRAGSSPFIAWLYRIAHNAVIDHYRTNKASIKLEDARPVEISHDDRADEKLDLQFEVRALQEALQELTEEQKEVLVLKFVEGLSTPEIAGRLGKQQGAVRALQMRALQGLARILDLEEEKAYER